MAELNESGTDKSQHAAADENQAKGESSGEKKDTGDHSNLAEQSGSANHGTGSPSHSIHWGYEGPNGPQNWGKLSDDYVACAAGKSQSPIDLKEGPRLRDLIPLEFNYKPSVGRLINNGHTVQYDYEPGSSLVALGKKYNLQQIHFHRPSEHKVDSLPYDMEIHLVHKNDSGSFAVVGVMVEEGTKNASLSKLWSKLPKKNDAPVGDIQFNAISLLPKKRSFYHYEGSLTTPPCSEGVKWFVLKESIKFSAKQVDDFVRVVDFNARPVQPGQRKIFTSWK